MHASPVSRRVRRNHLRFPSLVGHIAFIAPIESRAKAAAQYKPVRQKTIRRYSLSREKFNVPFFGDSCAYNDIHLNLLDPCRRSQARDHSSFVHCFQTQEPMVRNLTRMIAPLAIVARSLGPRFIYFHDQRAMQL